MLPVMKDLSSNQRLVVLATAFLGWMFAGVVMSLLPLAADSATQDLLGSAATKEAIGRWFIRYIVAFLLGGACGGLLFGWLGDRLGRAKAMGASILWYSAWTGASYLVQSPAQLTVLRFIACLGVGGMWPNGVALVSEAWPNVSRPALAGLIGTAANVGIMALGYLARMITVTSENWRWVLIAGSFPIVLAGFVLGFVPESPLWSREKSTGSSKPPIVELFRPPVLYRTIVGILLGVIPLLGAWGAGQWILPWAGTVGTESGDPQLKPLTQFYWGLGASLGSLSGGWMASRLGRRVSYFLISLLSLVMSAVVFRQLEPINGFAFFGPIFLLGFITTTFFGWLPYYLPELFATRMRATGTGVAFNFGRIISACVILASTGLVTAYQGDYAKIGATTSLLYVLGILVIWLAPKTEERIT